MLPEEACGRCGNEVEFKGREGKGGYYKCAFCRHFSLQRPVNACDRAPSTSTSSPVSGTKAPRSPRKDEHATPLTDEDVKQRLVARFSERRETNPGNLEAMLGPRYKDGNKNIAKAEADAKQDEHKRQHDTDKERQRKRSADKKVASAQRKLRADSNFAGGHHGMLHVSGGKLNALDKKEQAAKLKEFAEDSATRLKRH